MLDFPAWKKVLIWGICLLGVIFALPNLFYDRVDRHNQALRKIEAGAPRTPELEADLAAWPGWLPSTIVNLGLDLRGGAHLLVEVKIEKVYAERLDSYWPELRDRLRKARDTVGPIRRIQSPPDELRIRIGKPEAVDQAAAIVRKMATPVATLTGGGATDIEVKAEGDTLVIRLSEAEKRAILDRTVQQALEIIRRRVDEVGTREPTIQRVGERRILIEVPGLGSAAELKKLIGTTARLTFHPVIGRTTSKNTRPKAGQIVLPAADEPGLFYILDKTPVVTGDELVNAQPAFDRNGRPSVTFRFNPAGARKFGKYTSENVGKPFAIVLDDKVISAPVIQEPILGGSGQITGSFTVDESTRLAVLLRAGALPAPLDILEERTIGPELGRDSIKAGKIAAIVAFVLVMAYMWASYGLFGIFANIALLFNVALLFALLSVIGATLTLPGIAGIVLTIGMAVDANVLIFERIREELRGGRRIARAIELGYEKALSAILDANITTLISAVILFAMGSGPVRGFAVTLGIGIITSVFTAIWVTRLLIAGWVARKRPKSLDL